MKIYRLSKWRKIALVKSRALANASLLTGSVVEDWAKRKREKENRRERAEGRDTSLSPVSSQPLQPRSDPSNGSLCASDVVPLNKYIFIKVLEKINLLRFRL